MSLPTPLFLSGLVFPLVLHPFPTRRSSDLVLLRRQYDVAPLWPRQAPFYLQLGKDRKSTRLNSSHRCISYAVFCLKKKIKTCILLSISYQVVVERIDCHRAPGPPAAIMELC